MWWSVQRCLTLLLLAPIGGLRANVIRNEADMAPGGETGNNIVKRAHGSGAHDYGPPIRITSSVLQLSGVMAGDASQASIENGSWKPDSSLALAADRNVWLNAQHSLESVSGHVPKSGSVFSSDAHRQQFEPVGAQQRPSDSDDDVLHLSDNVDFNNVADDRGRQSKHTMSYGR